MAETPTPKPIKIHTIKRNTWAPDARGALNISSNIYLDQEFIVKVPIKANRTKLWANKIIITGNHKTLHFQKKGEEYP